MTLQLAVVAAVVLLALYVTWTAGRLDRLHARVDAAWAALDAQLVRRAAAARALAAAVPEPGRREAVRRAAEAALAAGPVDREALENALTRALRAALPLLPEGVDRGELRTAAERVALARSFHNAAVSDARGVRRRRLVRGLRLAGHRVLPRHFDIDVAPLEEVSPVSPAPTGGPAAPAPTLEGPAPTPPGAPS